MSATLRAIYISRVEGGSIESLSSAEIRTGGGIVGDRYADDSKRGITVFSREDFVTAVTEAGLAGSAADGSARRNLEVEGVNRQTLHGPFLQVGEVLLQYIEEAHPCGIMERSVGKGARAALKKRAGARFSVIRGGTVRVGDSVSAANPTDMHSTNRS